MQRLCVFQALFHNNIFKEDFIPTVCLNFDVGCSEATLTGESQFHISTPLRIEPGSPIMGSKRVDHWTNGTVYDCYEIAGSPHGVEFVTC
jgi:hypothetical protein